MDAHIIPNFAGYLPYLTDGLQLLTQAGTTVTVRIVGRNFYINNARIIASNLILENGVAHVLDQVRIFLIFVYLSLVPYSSLLAHEKKKIRPAWTV